MEAVIAGVLRVHGFTELEHGYWYCSCGHDLGVLLPDDLHAAHQARAVLAAISEAGTVEWVLFRKTDGPDAHPFDASTHKTQAQARSRIERMYLPHMHDILEPRCRITITTPWTAVVDRG